MIKTRNEIYVHEAQLRAQRAAITKLIETLQYQQCLVIADFCGHYSSINKKMYQLIFVVYFRNEHGHIDWTYYNVLRSWEMLFKNGVFARYNEIILSRAISEIGKSSSMAGDMIKSSA